MVSWSNLPRDVVQAISERLDNGADYVRFRSVCSSWRSWAPKRPQFPWLLVKYKGDDGEGAVGLYDFPNPYFFRPPQLSDGITKGKIICGCSRGWISLLDSAPGISLHNPFTGARIKLPPFTDFPISIRGLTIAKVDDAFWVEGERRDFDSMGTLLAKKVILSSDPAVAPDHCVVMGMMYLGERLIFLLPGADSWIISPPLPLFEDIIFYEGQFYAVSQQRVFVCDPRSDAEVIEIPSASQYVYTGSSVTKSYLVESSGELLLVMTTEGHHPPSYTCTVYQVDLSSGQLKLMKLKNLGGRSLFLGLQSMSVSVASFPGCKANCIYSIELSYSHVDSTLRIDNNVAVFDMEDGSTRFISKLFDDTPDYWWSAHWLTPSLCD